LAPADGAFYAYADVAHLTDDSMAFAHELLAETGVAVAPGIDFDTLDGRRSIRFSFAGQAVDVETGLERLGDFLRQRRARRSAG
ncbi:MAG: aspartate aminotransferase, partial [Nocardioides sp.]|nr:aspartate aminotransferase [Nocardioides sp.]